MKKTNLCYFIFALSFCLSPSVFALRVVIDPGHGGNDLGAVRDSFVESKIVLAISQKVKAKLEAHKNIQAILTRESNLGVSLKERVDKANETGADLFISLHANTSYATNVTGMEFYFNSAKTPVVNQISAASSPTNNEVLAQIKQDFNFYDKTEKSLLLTRTIREFTEVTAQKSIIKRAPFYVIENTRMPSILVELGFISNRREAKKLTNPEYQNELAEQITKAILEYKEKSDKAPLL